jgi:transcriptional regulator with XRE-family HTH domain
MSKTKTKDATNVDKNIGRKIYELRLSQGRTRQDLGAEIGVTHQQLQKYENGVNRISAGRLYEVATILNVPVSFFYQDIQPNISIVAAERQRLCVEVMRDFQKIVHPDQQEAVRHVIKALITDVR